MTAGTAHPGPPAQPGRRVTGSRSGDVTGSRSGDVAGSRRADEAGSPPASAAGPVAPSARDGRAARLARALERAQGGEVSALDEVVRELNPLLWHVARSQDLSADDAVDVVQTTWLELLRRLDQIHSPSALTTWLVTATRREAWHTNARRRRSSAAEPDTLDAALEPALPADHGVGDGERSQALWRNFHRLPARCRELLRVVAIADRPDYTTLAEALGMPRGSIGPTRGRCLGKLRELLLADPAWSPS
jgi:RNA polymerase sigma factor (sigma-70 family)